ncbi:MAG: hypothetical protein WC399_00510 [Bacilli bacterium]|jgi:hypothetical protein
METLIILLEAKRLQFIKLFKTTKLVNNIVLIIIVLGMGAAFLWLMELNMNLALIIVGALIVTLFLYSRFSKAWLGKQAYKYIFDYYRALAAYYYREPDFTALDIQEQAGFDIEEFRSLKILKNEYGIVSRNTVRAEFDRRPVSVSDAGVRVMKDQKVDVAFFGRIFKFELDRQFDDHVIIHHRRAKEGPWPEGFGDFLVVEERDDFIVLSQSGTLPASLNQELIKKLQNFVLDDYLSDASLVIFDRHAYLLMSYADVVMNVVYEQPVNAEAMKRFEDDLESIKGLVDLLPH